VCQINFPDAIRNGRIGSAPIKDAKTIEPDDSFSGDDSLFASFDLDAAIQNLKHGRNALPTSRLGSDR
jgi:hypothetical protein